MLCDVCKQREANVVMQTLTNGQIITRSMCAECAKKARSDLARAFMNIGIHFQGLQRQAAAAAKEKSEAPVAICRACGMLLSELEDATALGCPACYEAFRSQIAARFFQTDKPEQPESDHDASSLGEEQQIMLQLEHAVVSEDYEKAAELRDRLKALCGHANMQEDEADG